MAQKRPAKSRKTSTSKKKSTTSFSFAKIWNDERTPKVIGVTLIFLSIILLIAFTSYIFTFRVDQNIPDGELPANVLGRIGAWLANSFFYNSFGISSFILIPVIFATGFKILTKTVKIPLVSIYKYSFLSIIWFSTTFGFFFSGYDFPWGGAFGNYTSELMAGYIGGIGTFLVLAFTLLLFLILTFNIQLSFDKLGKLSQQIKRPRKKESFLDDDTVVKDWEQKIEEENQQATTEETPLKVETTDLDSSFDLTETTTAEPEPPVSDLDLEVAPIVSEPTEVEPTPEVEMDVEEPAEDHILDENELPPYDPTLDLTGYKYPPLDLLKVYGSGQIKVDTSELEKNKNQIIETLSNYNIEISKIKATIGPTVTLYEIVPAPGVRISKIKNLEDDIALSLAALGIRIIAPIPGKGTIGIEVPNVKKEIVSMHSLIASEKFQHSKFELPVVIGKNIANEIIIEDLAKMPHLLMAGATGQGKSVGINALIVSLLYKKHPSQLKLVMVDPKKVELSLYSMIEKHFLAKLPGEEDAIVTDTKKVVHTLNALCIEMDNRYDLLKEAQVRNLKEYNAKFIARRLNPNKGHQYLPYIVLIVDEFADLMMTAGKEVETPIARLAQLARAIGIHLIIATQRPTVNIITGTIKANFPARVAFKVTSKVDSRTILDAGGADQLIGRGDMLMSTGSDIMRLQCGFVDTPEVEDICKHIEAQQGYPSAFMLPEYEGENEDTIAGLSAEDRDPLFEDAARTVVQAQQGSTSLIQRRLKLGYNRAGRLMDQLEAAGVVGPNQGSKAREVLYPDVYQLEQFLNGEQ